jgi:hypothetical protein
MNMGIDETGHDHQIPKVLVGCPLPDMDYPATLMTNRRRTHAVRQDYTPAAKGRHHPNLSHPPTEA